MTYEHFKGKSVYEHLKEARKKGATASAEVHGTEMPGHLAAAADAVKGTTIALTILWVILTEFSLNPHQISVILLLFSLCWVIWKMGRSALLGWARLERLHRVIEEERWEIEHHRAQEREELKELYAEKGFSGKLLDEVTDVLMADDNRLLKVMLEEELNLTLEAYEHPLKQCIGAGVGVAISSGLCVLGYWLLPSFGIMIPFFALLIFAAAMTAKLERNRVVNTIIWTLSVAALTVGGAYFLSKLFLR